VSDSSGPAVPESAFDEVADRLAGLLPEDALQDALEGLRPEEITGPGGLTTQLAGRVLETALGAELTEHLGFAPGQAPPGGAGNARNGSTSKRLKTELGTVEIHTPRDRQGSFEPQLVKKRQTRLAGLASIHRRLVVDAGDRRVAGACGLVRAIWSLRRCGGRARRWGWPSGRSPRGAVSVPWSRRAFWREGQRGLRSGGGRQRADAGQGFRERVAPGPAGREVQGPAAGAAGQAAGQGE